MSGTAPRLLLTDSREKWTQDGSTDTHIKDYLIKHDIPYKVVKLDTGDYTFDGTIVVDRKQNLEEVSRNLLNRNDSSRFWREVRRAYQSGIKLVILVEHGPSVKSINDVAKWRSAYSGVSGRAVVDAMIRCEMAYGVVWQFCSKRSTAKKIIEILSSSDKLNNKIKLKGENNNGKH